MRKPYFTLASVILISTVLSGAISTVSFQSNGSYDPWVDLNDDGTIDIFDIVAVALAFGASGTPINKTALLLNLQATIEALNATVIDLEHRVSVLEGGSSGGVVKIVSESVNGVTHATTGYVTVTFPGGSFANAPDIVHCFVVLREASGALARGTLVFPNISGITTTQFDVEVVEEKGSSTKVTGKSVTVIYLAIDLA
jgi:hypothetical protein